MVATPKKSPLAPASFPELLAVGGVRLATAACGVKYLDRKDVLLGAFDGPRRIAPSSQIWSRGIWKGWGREEGPLREVDLLGCFPFLR